MAQNKSIAVISNYVPRPCNFYHWSCASLVRIPC